MSGPNLVYLTVCSTCLPAFRPSSRVLLYQGVEIVVFGCVEVVGPVVRHGVHVNGCIRRRPGGLRAGIGESETVVPVGIQDLIARGTGERGAARAQRGVLPVRGVDCGRLAKQCVRGTGVRARRRVCAFF